MRVTSKVNKIMVYGMQSSGATLFSCLLGQLKKSVVVADVWSNFRVPELKIENMEKAEMIVSKAVITEKFSYEDHKSNFSPDVSILFLRHPVHNMVSLRRKGYRNDNGTIEKKMSILDEVFSKKDKSFDAIIHYEDMMYDKKNIIRELSKTGINLNKKYFGFPRSIKEIKEFNFKNSKYLKRTYKNKWGFGNVKKTSSVKRQYAFKCYRKKDCNKSFRLCPNVKTYMDKYYRRNIPKIEENLMRYYDCMKKMAKRYLK